MQIPILSGIYVDGGPDIRTAYPVNMVAVPTASGISNGYLRPAEGIVHLVDGPGKDRGGIIWNGSHYRVMGTKLVKITSNNIISVLGDVGGDESEYVIFDYSFDRLAVTSDRKLFYWNGTTLTQVTDPDLGPVINFCWVDGYFITTDGAALVVTELTDPTQVNPLKYGSSEVDPDPVVALLRLRNEVYALNRHTIEAFDNVGGEFFPFQRIEGAQVQKGCVGVHACCVFIENIAFLGSGRNEAPAIYVAANATATKISTQEIDDILLAYTEDQLATVKLESRVDRSHQYLYVHLPDRTLVFDAIASRVLNQEVWSTLVSTSVDFAQYRARNFTWAYGQWYCGDPASNGLGHLTRELSHHWDQIVRWEFGTLISFNEGNGAIFHQIELVALTGSVALGVNPTITTSHSTDGRTWGQDWPVNVGTTGQYNKRICWFRQGHMRQRRIQRFRGDSQAHVSFLRLDARIEPLNY